MKCIDCIEKEVKNPEDAEYFLINDYESVRPLCSGCLQDYIEMEGEINLDFYMIKITGPGEIVFINRVNAVLKYLNEMNKRYSDRYFAVKKLVKSLDDEDLIPIKALREAIEW